MRSITDKAWIHKYAGLSTDVKPVSDGRNVILNGSIFVEMDTSAVYMYDDEHLRWIKVNTSSSGGGGGGEGASDAGDVSYDKTAAYSSGTVGKELNDLNRQLSDLETRLKSGDEEDADLHLGFYLDENGDLCQVDEEVNNG